MEMQKWNELIELIIKKYKSIIYFNNMYLSRINNKINKNLIFKFHHLNITHNINKT